MMLACGLFLEAIPILAAAAAEPPEGASGVCTADGVTDLGRSVATSELLMCYIQ